MAKKLEGKIALITGGSRGIGAGIARRLASDGASVAITYTKGADAAMAVVAEIERDGGKAIAIPVDAADVRAVTGAVERTVSTSAGWTCGSTMPARLLPKTPISKQRNRYWPVCLVNIEHLPSN